MGVLQQKDVLFLNVAGGRLVNKKRQVSAPGYEGRLVGIRRTERVWDGQIIPTIEIRMVDGNEMAIIQFNAESFYATGFADKIRRVDLSKPFSIGAYGSKTNDKISYCSFIQFGNNIKFEEGVPQPTDVIVGKKTVKDWTDFNLFFDNVLEGVVTDLSNVEDLDQINKGTAPRTDKVEQTAEPTESSVDEDEIPF